MQIEQGKGKENVPLFFSKKTTKAGQGVAFALFALLVATSGIAEAKPSTAQVCEAAKLKATGQKEFAKLKCYRQAVKADTPVDPACLTHAETNFDNSIAAADAEGECSGDGPTLEATVVDYVDDVESELPAGGDQAARNCTAKKVKATSKKAKAKLGCYRQAVLKGTDVDQACLGKAEKKFNTVFAKAEQKGGCNTIGDAAALETETDNFVTDVLAVLACGNGNVDPGEDCDGANLDDMQCSDLESPGSGNFNGGTLSCDASCHFDTDQCTYCGDGVKNDGEACDDTDLGGATCSSATGGFKPNGSLSCFDNCTFNTGSCTP